MKKVTIEVIDNKVERDNLVERVEVLDRVKELLLLPDNEFATINQVANFYNVDKKTLTNQMRFHEEELLSDGYKIVSGKDLATTLKRVAKVENGRGHILINNSEKIPYTNLGLYTKRAILRVGMLLRDSEIAKEVRTQLLNIEEHTTTEVKSYEIDHEMELHTRLERAVATKLPALDETFNHSEFESKQDRDYSLEGNFYGSIKKSYVNGLVLFGLSLSLLLIKPFTNQEQIRQGIK
ncbi:hypothetical protein [Bacillus mycoides]|uniref:hypothetical protein n=1 Tax=Bacillus mycoides TaxID=1405 RepID=UPI0008156BCA|nr:hypothetical protein [Bacillus mycoides]SCC21487.1 Uncharacterized protein BW664_02106 [Bacillus mycoides]